MVVVVVVVVVEPEWEAALEVVQEEALEVVLVMAWEAV
jgi:hypothetical protein